MGNRVGKAAQAATSQLTAMGVSSADIGYSSLVYPAVGVLDWGVILTDGGAYLDSVDQGEATLRSYLAWLTTYCPHTKSILIGYSQGAHVVHRVIDSGLSDAALDNIGGVLLIADPIGTGDSFYTHIIDPVTGADWGPVGSGGILLEDDISARIANRVIAICFNTDVVCNGGSSTSVHGTYNTCCPLVDILAVYGTRVGTLAAGAAPVMAYDYGTTMGIYRWWSDGFQITKSPAVYQSGTFDLANVGNRVASGDVDGDGRDDVVMAYQYSNGTFGFYVFRNGHGPGQIWYTSGSFSLGNVAGRLVVDDFNGDGKAEPALAYTKGTTMTIYRWLSTGTSFSRTTDYNSGTFSLANVGDRMASGDVDGDGKADIVMAYQLGDGTFGFYVFKSGASSLGRWYTSGTFNLANVGGRMVVADFNGDGKAEPALVYDKGSTMTIYRWLSTGSSFSRTSDYNSGTFYLGNVGDRVAAASVNGDKLADIVMAYQLPNGSFSYYVFASGLFSEGVYYTSGSFSLGNVGGRLVMGVW
jgi:hypothetical protein